VSSTIRTAAVFLLGFALAGSCRAADPSEHLNELEPPQPKLLPDRPDGFFQLPPVAPEESGPSLLHGGPTARVERIEFEGNTVFAAGELEAVAAPYIGRTLDAADLENLRRAVTRHYTDAGYINSGALLKKGSLEGGTLVVTIVEGRLNAVHLSGLEGLNPRYMTSRLDEQDKVLNIDTLRERFQMLLADPLISQMNARLVPGSALGEADLDIDVTRAAPYSLTAYGNNYRPPSIGAEAFGLRGSARNLTGQGDLLEITAEEPIEGDGAFGGSVHWHMPLIQPATQLVLEYDHGDSAVTEEPVNILGIKSVLVSAGIGIEQTLYDSLQQHLSVSLMRFDRQNRTSLLGQPFSFIPGEPNGDTEAPAWRFVQDYTNRSSTQVFSVRSTFSFVSDNEQSQAGLPATIEPERDYSIWLGQAQYARQVLDNGAQFVARATVQATRSHVLPLDDMEIGGDATVRGYRENQLLSDAGEIVNLEFNYPILREERQALEISLIPFYDIGHGRDIGQPGVTLSSVGLATQVHWHALQLDLSKGYRLVYPSSLVTGRGNLQDRGIYFQLQYTVVSK
jgi:hemolysin activation/secretion protein